MRLQEVAHEVLLNSSIQSGFIWKQREEFTDERIGDLDIWDNHGCRVSCKGLEVLDYDSRV